MKKTFLALLLSLFLYSITLPLLAEVTVDDFSWNMEKVDRYFAGETFKSALNCGDKASFQAAKNMCTISCEQRGIFTMCQTLCIPPDINSEKVVQEVVACEDNKVTIFGSDGDIRTITKDDFHKYKKNPLRELFNELPSWLDGANKVTIYQMTSTKHTLGWGTENERKVPALQLQGQIHYATGTGSDQFEEAIFTVILDESIPWFARAARVRLTGEGTMWRLDEVL